MTKETVTIFHLFFPNFSPPFEVLEVWLESLAIHTSVGHHLPTDLIFDIDHYKGSASRESSLSSTPDGMNTPPACKTPRLRTPDGLKTPVNNETNSDLGLANDKTDDSELDSKCDNNSNPNAQSVRNDTSEWNSIAKINENENIPKADSVPAACSDAKKTLIDIPKSPHLSKDFSPNGDRIRDSVRARRQQRIQQNRESMRKLSDCRKNDGKNGESSSNRRDGVAGESVSLNDIQISAAEGGEKQKNKIDENGCNGHGKKIRPYGEKGFIINVNGGLLTLNNVKDLENCSDFDSSCDTSLNYIESNAPIEGGGNTIDSKLIEGLKALPEASPTIKLNSSCEMENEQTEPTLPDVSATIDSNGGVRNKSYKTVLEDLKIKLNLCKSKLETLESAGRETISSSRTSMRNYFKSTPLVHGNTQKITANTEPLRENGVMYSRSSPLSLVANRKSMFEDVAENEKLKLKNPKSKLFRINDTPIFERRNVRAISSLFRRSDSDENITSKASYKSNGSETTVQPTTFIFNKPKISPTSDLKANHSFDTMVTPHMDDDCRTKRGNFTLRKISNKPEVFQSKPSTCPKPKEYIDRRSWSVKTNPIIHNENRRQSKQLFHIEPSTINSNKSASGKVNLLSPERIHKLNAKLTEAKSNPKSQQPMSNHLAHGNGYLNRIYAKPSSTPAGHNHHLMVHKLPDSMVRRNVSKFDKSMKGCGLESTTPL